MGGGFEFLWDRRSGVNSHLGLVCFEKSSGDAASELFVFCDNMPRDVVAGLFFWGVDFSNRASNGSCTDGGTRFAFSMFWTAEDAFPGVLCVLVVPSSML